ncbi:MAG: (d)CMP kinase [Planctomycetes bacterium]|nr:(d)CMP kinase [Planctomycetota bacterium]
MIVTIDGPAGSGKSTAARKLAARLELPYLDTGAMYRAIAYAALSRGVDPADEDAVIALAREVSLELDCGPTHTRVRLDGHDVSEAIRSLAVSEASGAVARIGPIRELLIARQRQIARDLGSIVTEGRDQGAVVFPEADAKFVVVASLERRVRRRLEQLAAEGEDADIEAVRENLRVRDEKDSPQWAPLLDPGQAIVIDTSHLTIAQVIDMMSDHVLNPRAG